MTRREGPPSLEEMSVYSVGIWAHASHRGFESRDDRTGADKCLKGKLAGLLEAWPVQFLYQ